MDALMIVVLIITFVCVFIIGGAFGVTAGRKSAAQHVADMQPATVLVVAMNEFENVHVPFVLQSDAVLVARGQR
jgi:hypothetical protein